MHETYIGTQKTTKKISHSLHMTRGEKKYFLNAEESACKTSIKKPQSWHSFVDKQNCQKPKLLHQIRQYPVPPIIPSFTEGVKPNNILCISISPNIFVFILPYAIAGIIKEGFPYNSDSPANAIQHLN
ncbi:MAG: hypothetical protein SPK48_08280, partial [Bullifex sp.]|nr:hypothetical protein [Spirochaetales bacterium]MDY5777825.1 hypothetical protein [Bullifex sp.]